MLAAGALVMVVGFFAGWQFAWIAGAAAGVLSYPVGQATKGPRDRIPLKNHGSAGTQ